MGGKSPNCCETTVSCEVEIRAKTCGSRMQVTRCIENLGTIATGLKLTWMRAGTRLVGARSVTEGLHKLHTFRRGTQRKRNPSSNRARPLSLLGDLRVGSLLLRWHFQGNFPHYIHRHPARRGVFRASGIKIQKSQVTACLDITVNLLK